MSESNREFVVRIGPQTIHEVVDGSELPFMDWKGCDYYRAGDKAVSVIESATLQSAVALVNAGRAKVGFAPFVLTEATGETALGLSSVVKAPVE